MIRRSIVFLLLLSLVAPLNSGAAAWMSLSMSEQGEANHASTDDHRHADHPMHGDGHAHGQHADGHLHNPQPHGSSPAHDGHGGHGDRQDGDKYGDRHDAAHSQGMHGDGHAHGHHTGDHPHHPQPHGSAPAHDDGHAAGHEATHSPEMHGDRNAHDHHGAAQLHESHSDGHSEADCESECLSCTNHCSSLALLSQSNEGENGNLAIALSPSHRLSSLAEKLLRPPILA